MIIAKFHENTCRLAWDNQNVNCFCLMLKNNKEFLLPGPRWRLTRFIRWLRSQRILLLRQLMMLLMRKTMMQCLECSLREGSARCHPWQVSSQVVFITSSDLISDSCQCRHLQDQPGHQDWSETLHGPHAAPPLPPHHCSHPPERHDSQQPADISGDAVVIEKVCWHIY